MFHIRMSIRQLLRTPVKTFLFVLLLAVLGVLRVSRGEEARIPGIHALVNRIFS